MSKKYFNYAIIYSIIAMVMGAFYREFTKFFAFTDKTSLSIIHTHYFAMGMIFFMIIAMYEKNLNFSQEKHVSKAIAAYNICLNITGLIFLIRGVTTVLGSNVSTALSASLSGIAGLSHIGLVIALPYILFAIKKKI